MSVFTADHAAALLAFCTGVDDRFSTADPQTADARVRSWASILEGVDPQWALGFARRAYSKARDRMLTPGEIRTGWLDHVRVEDSRTVPRATGGRLHVGPAPEGAPETLWDYLAALRAAAARGADPTTVPRPVSARVMSRADDLRSRQCDHWRTCACDHSRCRGGFLDVEDTATNMLGLVYQTVTRCPHCQDAALMAADGTAAPRRGRASSGWSGYR